MTEYELLIIKEAIENGDSLYVSQLLLNASSPNDWLYGLLPGTNLFPIHYAIECERLCIVKHMLAFAPALVNLADVYSQSPLIYATINDDINTVEYLLSHNADETITVNQLNHPYHGKTAFDLAIHHRYYAIANALILKRTKGQALETILPFILSGLQAVEFMLQKPELADLLVADERISQLLTQADAKITQKTLSFYKTSGRRPSFFGMVDRENHTSSVFYPEAILGGGSCSTTRLFYNGKNDVIIVKAPTDMIELSPEEERLACQALFERETQFNQILYPNDDYSAMFNFFYKNLYTYRSIRSYVPGETAWALMSRITCPHELAKIIAAMARGLNDLHEKGVIHGDQNPANYIIKEDPKTGGYTVHLIDFEHSYFLTDETAELWEAQHRFKTWIAPELCNDGKCKVKPSTSQDVYGLGYALWYTLHDKLHYETLLSTYSLIESFISTSCIEQSELRPDLKSFYTQLDNEIHLNDSILRDENDQENNTVSLSCRT